MNKKIISLLLVITMVMTLCACNNEAQTEENKVETMEKEETASTESMKSTEQTEPVDDIELEGVARETEPSINKATIITAEEKDSKDDTKLTEKEIQDTKKETVPVETIPAEEVGVAVEEKTEYEKLMEMSGEEQKKFMDSFESLDAFFAWLEAAKAEYETKKPAIEIGSDGVVNIG